MKKAFISILTLLFIGSQMTTVSIDINPDQQVKIGLAYGSGGSESYNVFYDKGFDFGYYDSDNSFVTVISSDKHFISVAKDDNLYYSGSKLSTSDTSGTLVGAYHVQYDVDCSDTDDIDQVIKDIENLKIDNVFPAYVNGKLMIRSGSYSTSSKAKAALDDASKSGYNVSVVGGKSNAFTVVDMNSGVICFEFDDNDIGKFAVAPIKGSSDDAKLKNGATYYYGNFEFLRQSDGKMTMINVLDMQNYIKGILPYEMSATWPLEALKAQAVCARNYAYKNLGKHKSDGFDLCDTDDCQVYGGSNSTSDNSNLAVDETYGAVLTYNGSLAQCFYHSSSGGYTENVENIWNTPIPYLIAVTTPYEHLEKVPNGIWSYEVSTSDLTKLFNSKGYNVSDITDIYVDKYTDAGNVYRVIAVDSNGKKISLEKETARIRLSPYVRSQRFDILKKISVFINKTSFSTYLNSLCYLNSSGEKTTLPANSSQVSVMTGSGQKTLSVPKSDDGTFLFSGAGRGNNVGMSQWSAHGMADEGYTYEDILSHYFPGTKLETIK